MYNTVETRGRRRKPPSAEEPTPAAAAIVGLGRPRKPLRLERAPMRLLQFGILAQLPAGSCLPLANRSGRFVRSTHTPLAHVEPTPTGVEVRAGKRLLRNGR